MGYILSQMQNYIYIKYDVIYNSCREETPF